MLYKKIFFDEDDKDAYIEIYVSERIDKLTRKGIIVIPGGGYHTVCAEREGEPIAMAFLPYGYNAFVLHYTVNKAPFPSQLIQASKAIKHIKDNAEEYNIDADNIFVVGFSAGGHLAASLGTMWNMNDIYANLDMPFGYNKPKGMMLIYPVISTEHHKVSFDNLLMNENPSKKILELCSIEKQVSDKTCPAFILHSSNDQVVNVKNSLAMANALSENGIKYEMHIYPDAPHGVALGNEITKCGVDKWCNESIAEWVRFATKWADYVIKEG